MPPTRGRRYRRRLSTKFALTNCTRLPTCCQWDVLEAVRRQDLFSWCQISLNSFVVKGLAKIGYFTSVYEWLCGRTEIYGEFCVKVNLKTWKSVKKCQINLHRFARLIYNLSYTFIISRKLVHLPSNRIDYHRSRNGTKNRKFRVFLCIFQEMMAKFASFSQKT